MTSPRALSWASALGVAVSACGATTEAVSTAPPTATASTSATTTTSSSSSSTTVSGAPSMSVGHGPATTTTEDLAPCAAKGARKAGVGLATTTDGQSFVVPAETAFAKGSKATPLYDECAGVLRASVAELDLASVPVVEIDADGEVVTGYLFADNYFELYVNGVLVAVDATPYTPFDSSVVRFRVKRPYTLAARLVDWEEHLGLGTEANKGVAYHAGDGGFVASFSDGTATDASWRAQTFYVAPLRDPACLHELSGRRDSSTCAYADELDGSGRFAAHFRVPADWALPAFDDAAWPLATTFTDAEVGVNDKPAFGNFVDVLKANGASFVWSTNLVLDNEVLVRKRVE